MGFVTGNEEWNTDFISSQDHTFSYGSNEQDTSLAKFLERPVKVKEYNWTVGGSLDSTFNPWTEFFNNAPVASRMTNYYLIRCNLRMQVLVNGTPFHYGRAMVTYKPLEDYDTTATPTTIQGLLMQYSQRPLIYVNPTTSVGGSMSLPYMWNENYFTIPLTSWTNAGKVRVSSFGNLKHANAGSTPVNITIFVWATDVVLTQTTDTLYAPQSGEVKAGSEFSTAPVSTVASAVADVASSLKKYAVIGKFAKATEMGARAVANIARLFGYSRPQILTKIQLYKPRLNGNFTNTDQDEAVVKLTADSKNELSIDPSIVGLAPVDEMSLVSIVTRESYLTNFAWDQGDSSGTFLFNVSVAPSMWYYDAANGEYNLTPLAFASQPFQYWTGTIEYRFQVIASAYHKGRIRISYDPDGGTGSEAEFNTVISRVLDISHDTEAIIEVPWAQSKPFAKVQSLADNFNAFSSTVVFSSRTQYDNGVISIRVLNELVTPDSSLDNDISVNVFVRAKEDYKLAGPTLKNLDQQTYFRPQSGTVPVEAEDQSQIGSDMPVDNLFLVYMGEEVLSIRALMKRYTLHSTESIDGISTSTVVYNRKVVRSAVPNYRGYDPQGINTAANTAGSANVPYNWTRNTYLNYFKPAYTAWRGSIRTKYLLESTDTRPRNFTVERTITGPYSSTDIRVFDGVFNKNKLYKDTSDLYPTCTGGGHLNLVTHSGALEVEYPYYNPYRFSYAKNLNANVGVATDGTTEFFVAETVQEGLAAEPVNVLRYIATGEDFALHGFLGVPLMFIDATPAANI